MREGVKTNKQKNKNKQTKKQNNLFSSYQLLPFLMSWVRPRQNLIEQHLLLATGQSCTRGKRTKQTKMLKHKKNKQKRLKGSSSIKE